MNKTDISDDRQSEQPMPKPLHTVLFEEHIKLTQKTHFAEFAGYLMPLWYSSASLEHTAVREKAGLFDCTHMGVFEINGSKAAEFLNLAATNDINSLSACHAQYSYILDKEGNVLDDIIIYKIAEDEFMAVVNAANKHKIKKYLTELLEDKKYTDITIKDEQLVDIALQGPDSIDILLEIVEPQKKETLKNLKSFNFLQIKLNDIDCIVSKTGYTGSKDGVEIFVSPENAVAIWQKLLEKGKSHGLLPCGLASRDSLRIEAGLPLYGHELDGKFNITPFEASYSWAVKLQKEKFIGKSAIEEKTNNQTMKTIRIELPGSKGIRPVRADDGLLDADGKCIGWVLSAAKVGEKQIVIGYVDINCAEADDKIGVYYLARSQNQIKGGKKESVKMKESCEIELEGTVLKRFAKF